MNTSLWLPWFPVLLATGVGSRLLGSRGGLGLGLLCAVFWTAVVHATVGPGVWRDPWDALTMISGAAAIVAVGAWSGLAAAQAREAQGAAPAAPALRLRPIEDSDSARLDPVAAAVEQFDDWLERHRLDTDPWNEFGELIRTVLYQMCRATHVRLYRIVSEGDELLPIRAADPLADADWRSARKGVLGHVATTGRSFVAGDEAGGELVQRLADGSQEPLAWVFAVTAGARRAGVVAVGQLDGEAIDRPALRRCAERLVNQFWLTLTEVCHSRQAGTRDPVSGLLTRETFFNVAQHALRQAYGQAEPAVVAVIALEQLRRLNDNGRWDVADELIREVSALLQRKVRSDDHLGRFDGTRFLLFLRRVDSHLALLILEQLMNRLQTLCDDRSRWGTPIQARCGVSGSGVGQPPLTALVAQALRLCRDARVNEVKIASDLGDDDSPHARKSSAARRASCAGGPNDRALHAAAVAEAPDAEEAGAIGRPPAGPAAYDDDAESAGKERRP